MEARIELLAWVQHHPASMDEPTSSLEIEMLHDLRDILCGEVSRIIDMGDGDVQLPNTLFERYVYPSAFLRSYLEHMRSERHAGGVECAFL